jgi:hypothetical protein
LSLFYGKSDIPHHVLEGRRFMSTIGEILIYVKHERERQEQLKNAGKFSYTCADTEMMPGYKLSVLAEEFGEVASIVNQQMGGDTTKRCPSNDELRNELVQVAAVAVAWAESL